jgi:hypothetical protein
MAVISKGQTFATGDQVTALKLNNLADNATFASGSVDNVSTQLSGGAIVVKDGGVTTAKLNDNAVTTIKIADANVTTAKIADANVTFAKLTDVIDDDTMATASATKLATSESIKVYVDASSTSGFSPSSYTGGESVTLPNGLIMKWGVVTATINGTAVSFGSAFPTGVVAAYSCPNSAENLKVSTGYSGKSSVDSLTTTGMNVSCDGSAYWQAIGY